MSRTYIGLGSNLGNRESNLREAVKAIGSSAGRVVACSSVYETEAWGFTSSNMFLNMVLITDTHLLPGELLKEIMKIESHLGRKRSQERYASRTIDIDILLYNNDIINDHDLVIPHPLMHKRKFVLVPFCEIAPEVIHPVLKKSMITLLKECNDNKPVRKLQDW
jgi:2-amino-4-hydroxy-6-hydroxymethyldihydropteridine diphosphokinase